MHGYPQTGQNQHSHTFPGQTSFSGVRLPPHPFLSFLLIMLPDGDNDSFPSFSHGQETCALVISDNNSEARKLSFIITNIPVDLIFFLQPNPPYNKATVNKLVHVIQYVFPDVVESTGSPSRRLYLTTSTSTLPLILICTWGSLRIALSKHNKIHMNILQFNPNQYGSTKHQGCFLGTCMQLLYLNSVIY